MSERSQGPFTILCMHERTRLDSWRGVTQSGQDTCVKKTDIIQFLKNALISIFFLWMYLHRMSIINKTDFLLLSSMVLFFNLSHKSQHHQCESPPNRPTHNNRQKCKCIHLYLSKSTRGSWCLYFTPVRSSSMPLWLMFFLLSVSSEAGQFIYFFFVKTHPLRALMRFLL